MTLHYVGAAQGWTLPGVPARAIEENELEALGVTSDDLIASGCYVREGEDHVAAFNAAREALTAHKVRTVHGVDEEGQEVMVTHGLPETATEHPLLGTASFRAETQEG